jgi:DNA-binding response OmpR family regulator
MQTKILYVEDEIFLGKIVAESLESRGYDVNWVQDGANVLGSLNTFLPDICILDVMLPNVNGFDLGTQIRHEHPKLPIIFLTAKDQTEDVLKGFSSGGNDYLRKPFSIEELIVRIENLLSVMTKSNIGSETIRIGKFVFSPTSMELTSNDATIRLSHRESELMKVFVRFQNLPVERKQILKEIWGDDSFFNSRNLDVYITRLRKYLRDDPGLEIITLKGVGYQFRVS